MTTVSYTRIFHCVNSLWSDYIKSFPLWYSLRKEVKSKLYILFFTILEFKPLEVTSSNLLRVCVINYPKLTVYHMHAEIRQTKKRIQLSALLDSKMLHQVASLVWLASFWKLCYTSCRVYTHSVPMLSCLPSLLTHPCNSTTLLSINAETIIVVAR